MIWFHLGPAHLIVDGIGLPHWSIYSNIQPKKR